MSVVKIISGRLNEGKDMGKLFNVFHACLSLALGRRTRVTKDDGVMHQRITCSDVVTVATFQDPSNYLRELTFNRNLYAFSSNRISAVRPA